MTKITLRELIQNATHIYLAGMCECGQKKFDLSCKDNLAYEPVHESAIKTVRPELLEKEEYYADQEREEE